MSSIKSSDFQLLRSQSPALPQGGQQGQVLPSVGARSGAERRSPARSGSGPNRVRAGQGLTSSGSVPGWSRRAAWAGASAGRTGRPYSRRSQAASSSPPWGRRWSAAAPGGTGRRPGASPRPPRRPRQGHRGSVRSQSLALQQGCRQRGRLGPEKSPRVHRTQSQLQQQGPAVKARRDQRPDRAPGAQTAARPFQPPLPPKSLRSA